MANADVGRRLDPDPAAHSSWVSIGVFVGLSYALAWLVSIPIYLTGGLRSPLFLVCSVVLMFAPTAAALFTTKVIERHPSMWRNLAIWPVPSWKRLVGFVAVALVAIFILCVLGLVSSAVLGTYVFDLKNFGGLAELVRGQLAAAGQPQEIPMPLPTLAVVATVQLAGASLIAGLAAFGEEVGWRGFLQPRLQARLGAWGSVLVMGVVWGVWHSPLLLMGYNYPGLAWPLRLVFMSVFCFIGGTVLAWLRQRSGSVLVAAVGHGAINAMLAGTAILYGTTATFDSARATLMGWGGWPVGVLVAIVIVAAGGLRPWKPRRPAVKHSADDPMRTS